MSQATRSFLTTGRHTVTFNGDTTRPVCRRVSDDEERRSFSAFATSNDEYEFSSRLAILYSWWRDDNEQFFEGRLVEPHFGIGRTAHRSLGHCSRTTDYGGKVQITLNAGLVFGTNAAWVVHRWPPALGTERFIADFVLRFAVRQFVIETIGADERGYRGYGPEFVKVANQVGTQIGLGPVVERRRGTDTTSALGRGWPHCVRPAGYYRDDVTEHALDLARGGSAAGRTSRATAEGMLDFILARLDRGQTDDVRAMLRRHLDWMRLYRQARLRPRRRVERGEQDVDGSPLGEVTIDLAWLDWNHGTVPKIARHILATRSYWDLPIMADALEDAGCMDGRILRHLREHMEHGPRCWVLRLVQALDAE